jgi:PPOX class probable F420-dependent enzyme
MAALTQAEAEKFVADRHWAVLVTIRASDGRPQLSNVGYALIDGVVRISVTDGRAKTANLRRDPRATLHVTSEDFWTYVVVDGDAELSPVARDPGDDTATALLQLYEAIAGPHPDPDEFRQAMVDDHRLQISIHPRHWYPVSG